MFEIGKSGYLPDISSSFNFWRTYTVNCMKQKDYHGARAGVYNLNACLTEEYVITISTKEYEKSLLDQSFFQCDYCTMEIDEIINKGEEDEQKNKIEVPTEIPYKDVKILELLIPSIDSLITGSQTAKVWVCPSCKKENVKKTEWNIITPTKEQPFYRKIVPECPMRLDGVSTRLGWDKHFSDWCYNFLEEIQVQMKFYRIEYISQTGHDMEDSGFKDKGDADNWQ